jgi:AhpD family alkylhydroperoxidase
MSHGKDVLNELRDPVRGLRQRIPAVFEAYGSQHSAVFADGALDAKTNELIALAVAVSKQCDRSMASHARGAARRGATEDEVAEALGVAILMNGGRGTVHAPRAFSACREFAVGT